MRFGPYEIDLDSGDLRKFGYRIKLQPKSFLVLRTLLQAPGEMVTREELRAQLWPENTFVEFESSLNVAVRRLREALSDEAQGPAYIETVPKHGYRFIGVLEPPAATAPPYLVPALVHQAASALDLLAHMLPGGAQTVPRRSWWKLLLPALAVLIIAVAIGSLLVEARRGSFAPVASSIAVLPFVDMSPEKNQQYFSDGWPRSFSITWPRRRDCASPRAPRLSSCATRAPICRPSERNWMWQPSWKAASARKASGCGLPPNW
jgi:DNA-binding winged helix-turn-helix (wHTH) protein